MSLINLYCYDSVNRQSNKTAKLTPKSFKVFHDDHDDGESGGFSLYKPHGIYNRLINITFPSGKVRQMVVLSLVKENGMMTSDEVVQQSLLAHLRNENDRPRYPTRSFKIVGDQYNRSYDGMPYLVQHKDDKVYNVFRWVIIRRGERDRARGQEVIYDLQTPLNEGDEIYRIKEQWIRWGDKDICCDTGVKTYTSYHYEEQYKNMVPKWKRKLAHYSSKNVSEFPTNPFSEGNHIVPRIPHTLPTGETVYVKEGVNYDVAMKSFLWKREIAEAAFRPERVAKMLERYGQDWIDEIA